MILFNLFFFFEAFDLKLSLFTDVNPVFLVIAFFVYFLGFRFLLFIHVLFFRLGLCLIWRVIGWG